MKSISTTFMILFIAILLLGGCSRKDATSGKKELMTDSTALADSSSAVASPLAAEVLSYEQRQGKELYTKYCSICHGREGEGDGFNAFNLATQPRDFTGMKYMSALSDTRIIETILKGGRGVNRSPLMPSWGGRLKNDEAAYVLSYVRSLGKSK